MSLVARDAPAITSAPVITPRARTLVIVSTFVLFVGMLFGIKLTGRFAVSNLAQLVGTALLFFAFGRLLRPRDLLLLGLGVVSVAIAAIATAAQYHYIASPFHAGYFLLAVVYLVALHRACTEHGAGPAFAEGIRRVLPVCAAVLVVSYLYEMSQGSPYPTLGFDDKSHGSVAACFLAFAALRFSRGPHRILLALVLFGIALITPSRLPYFFAPFFAVALMLSYHQIRFGAHRAWQVYLSHLVLAGAAVTPVIVAAKAGEYFRDGLDRVLADSGRAVASTESHLDLLAVGMQLKVENLWNLLFGITPGGFATTLYNSDVELRLYRLPYAEIADGTAPMHSTAGSIILEFPLWVAAGFIAVVIHALFRLLRRKEYILACFFVALMTATTFYSSHNELFFVMCLAVIVVSAYGRDPARYVGAPDDRGSSWDDRDLSRHTTPAG